MIEVEVNCIITEEQEKKLVHDTQFLGKEKITDVYYDTDTYELAQKDIRLRTRNGKFMLKAPMDEYEHLTDQIKIPKKEIEEEATIIALLNLPGATTLKEAIAFAGYAPRFTVNKTRKKYRSGDIVIDIDHVQRGDGIHRKCELEIIIESQDEIEQATKKLAEFAAQNGITVDKTKQSFIDIIKGN